MPSPNWPQGGALTAFLLLSILLASRSGAQIPRPGDVRPELPSFEPTPDDGEHVLPPLPMPVDPGTEALDFGASIAVRGYRIEGNRVLGDEELLAVTAGHRGPAVLALELEAVRDAIHRAYREQGYVTTEVWIPDQDLRDGIVEISVREGVIAAVEVRGLEHYDADVIADRIRPDPAEVFQVERVERRLQRLRRDRGIRELRARLLPGRRPGESILVVEVLEDSPWALGLAVSNHQTPSVGEVLGEVELAHHNPFGRGDAASLRYGGSEGSHDGELRYRLPLNRYETTLQARVQLTHSEIVEAPFAALDIENRTESYALGLSHPLYRSLASDLWLSLTGEWRRNTAWLDGRRFSFEEGPERGVAVVSVLRLGAQASHRSAKQVFALYTTLSLGLDVLGATRHSDSRPDGRYLSWLTQFQWARRLPFLESELVSRVDLQLANDRLLGLEQFAVGGHASVRGYRENGLVRDNGVLASVEWRVPLFDCNGFSAGAAPFFDYGHSWGARGTRGRQDLAGAGLGLRLAWGPASLRVDWAHPFHDVSRPSDDWALQDAGVYARLTISIL